MTREPQRRQSSFAATCTRRLRAGFLATAIGFSALVWLGSWLHAEWAVALPLIVMMILLAVVGTIFWRGGVEAARLVPERALQASVDALARDAGIVPPRVLVIDSRRAYACFSRPGVVIAPPSAVDAIALGEADERDEALSGLAHEVGHCRRPLAGLVAIAARSFPVLQAGSALLTFSLRSWALLTAATYVFVALPARWTARWTELAADETARELGYGEPLAVYLDAPRRPSLPRWPRRWLSTHPPGRERARLLRHHDETGGPPIVPATAAE